MPADFSLLLPIHNDGPHLLRTLFELDRRARVACEVIVYDRGSDDEATDGALDLAHSVMGPRLKVIRGEPGTTTGAALARCAERASGDVIGWWNAGATADDAALDRAADRVRDSRGRSIVALPVDRTALSTTAVEIDVNGMRHVVGAFDDQPVAEVGFLSRWLLQSLGAFDPSMDGLTPIVDLCLRAREAGHPIETLSGAGVRRGTLSVAQLDPERLRFLHGGRRAA